MSVSLRGRRRGSRGGRRPDQAGEVVYAPGRESRVPDRRAPPPSHSPAALRRRAGHPHPRPLPAGLPGHLRGAAGRGAARASSPPRHGKALHRLVGDPRLPPARTRRAACARPRRHRGAGARRCGHRELAEPALVVLKDFHAFLGDPTVVRALRELAQRPEEHLHHGADPRPRCCSIPVELEKEITVLDVPLPTARRPAGAAHATSSRWCGRPGESKVDLDRGGRRAAGARPRWGSPSPRRRTPSPRPSPTTSGSRRDDIELVLEEKRQVIRKSGLLEYYPRRPHAGQRGRAREPQGLARPAAAPPSPTRPARFGLPEPQGAAAARRAGLRQEPHRQGGRRHLAAAAAAPRHGAHLRRARRLVRGEHAPRHPGGRERGAGGALDRRDREGALRPRLLRRGRRRRHRPRLRHASSPGCRRRPRRSSWWPPPTASTCLPPELLRKGRFDEIFFVDLPDAAERAEIFRIHLRRRGREPERFDLAALAAKAEQFSGAEIEQVVVAGLHEAFADGVELGDAHLTGRWPSRCRSRSPCGGDRPPARLGLRPDPARVAALERAPLKFLARFQRLERARGQSTEGPGADPERFSALEVAAPLPEVRPPPSGRFSLPELPLELDRGGDLQPFVRCQACGRDSQRGTHGCGCGARLNPGGGGVQCPALGRPSGPPARGARRARAGAGGGPGRGATNDQRRALGEELAREVAERERARTPPLPQWIASIWIGAVLLVLLRLHRPVALALAVVVAVVLGGWWWMRRPPGQ